MWYFLSLYYCYNSETHFLYFPWVTNTVTVIIMLYFHIKNALHYLFHHLNILYTWYSTIVLGIKFTTRLKVINHRFLDFLKDIIKGVTRKRYLEK